jgi:hypothetical protein
MIPLRYLRAPAMVMLAFVLLIPGCKKKKPAVPAPAPQATAPTIVPEPEPEPVEPAMPEPSARGDAPPPDTTATAPAPKPKPRRRKPPTQVAKATPPPQPPAEQPSTTPPATQPAPQNAPPLSATIATESSQQQNEAEEMLTKTDANVRSVTRELNDEEKAMLRQIESFVQQARDALKVGDTVRAHNLAQKAHLLSTELAKR